MTDRELMQQALDAQEKILRAVSIMNDGPDASDVNHAEDLMTDGVVSMQKLRTALRERLAQPDPEPVAFGYLWPTGMHPEFRYTQQKRGGIDGTPVYTAPPRREWQGLTDEEMGKLRHLIDPTADWSYMEYARAIEAALKERNT